MIEKEIFFNGRREVRKMFFADLHIHSRFSRACSKDITIENLEKWARVKGLDLLGTGDFTHPIWLRELKEKLIDKGNGIFETQTGFKFILTGEISLMYTQGKGRRVHLVILVPSFEVADKINEWLDTKGRRDYDGRPIFKISCEDFVAKMKFIDKKIEVVPAHCWTPYFGVLGSKSGFDSLSEAFGSQINNIYAIETGISSDRNMNFGVDELKNKTILSFSDSHSFWPYRIGREATIFSLINTYEDIINQIRENKIIGTVETDPAYGIYHWDGHKDCGFSCSPDETKKINGLCPKCGKLMTIGVESRVVELTGKRERDIKIEFKILPLHEVISTFLRAGISSKKTWDIYNSLINKFQNEFNVLLVVEKEKLVQVVDEGLVDLIIKNREGQISVRPGYDGIYGQMILD